uniref:Ribonuclease A-domain domain-containing protein n=1 Tax=Oreochromis aureus TaxID=47969 RepID=A0AAZ1X5J3_OREAU
MVTSKALGHHYIRKSINMMKLSVFLLMLHSVILVWSVPPEKSLFEIQHIAKEGDTCDNLMNNLMNKLNELNKQNKEESKCKPRNTFIIDDMENVKKICNQRHVYYNLYASNNVLKMLHCKLKSTSPCKYDDEEIELHAEIACNNNKQPVHFECSFPSTSK